MCRLLCLGFFLAYAQCFMVKTPPLGRSLEQDDFPDRQPLILTPYVEKGDILGGQEAAQVVGILGNVESYSGYFTVNKTHNRNLFFWYFPAEDQPASSPVLLWLQGGPGGSSMYGLAQENGPFRVDANGSIHSNSQRWTKNHHVIYIDSPSGVGFSFPVPTSVFGEDQISADMYSALEQFFQLFPNIATNDFYVTGESYGGQYVPSVAYAIHKNNPTGKVKINLTGLMIGNGMISNNCFAYGNKEYDDYAAQNGLLGGDINPYNYLENGDGLSTPGMDIFFNQAKVQKNIHVGAVHYKMFNDDVLTLVRASDSNFDVRPIVVQLLQHYPIMYYYGQIDTACPYPPSEAELSRLKWHGYTEFQQAERRRWVVGDDLAGYTKSGGNLSLALVRNAGHMVPMDQPVWSLDLITKFINKQL